MFEIDWFKIAAVLALIIAVGQVIHTWLMSPADDEDLDA